MRRALSPKNAELNHGGFVADQCSLQPAYMRWNLFTIELWDTGKGEIRSTSN